LGLRELFQSPVAREPEFRADDADTVPYGLRRLLELGPLGSWA
jgi:hypothetical protein